MRRIVKADDRVGARAETVEVHGRELVAHDEVGERPHDLGARLEDELMGARAAGFFDQLDARARQTRHRMRLGRHEQRRQDERG
ncbi:MAG TPA: hypothetical protein VHB97_20030 [Polyangia bacterium]|nr:hypothetical protein [Polyangia bacterium]